MLRLGAANYGFRQWSIDDYLYALSGLGLKYAEIGYTRNGTLQQLYWVTDHARAVADSQLMGSLEEPDGLERIKELARRTGVALHASAANYRLWGVPPTWLDWARVNIRLDIEIGAALGLKVMRVCEVGFSPDTREEAVFDEVARSGAVFNELAKYAETHGVTLMAENFRASSNLILAFASQFTSPAAGIHFDPHNYRRVGEDPVQALRKIKEYVRYVHLKDFRREDAQRLPTDSWWPSWAVGEGEIEWRPLFEELASFYDGVLAIEYEKTLFDVLRGMRVSADYIRSTLTELGIPHE